MENISIRSADNLYWMGRYLQRTETLTKEITSHFDYVIDRDIDSGKDFFNRLGVDLNYKDSKTFLIEAVYGDHQSSLENVISNARENAIICRDLIRDGAFVAINDFYNQIKKRKESDISPHFLDKLLQRIDIVWGIIRSSLHVQKPQLLIQYGQRVEMIDLKIRLFNNLDLIQYDIEQLKLIGRELNEMFNAVSVKTTNTDFVLDMVNKSVRSIISYEN